MRRAGARRQRLPQRRLRLPRRRARCRRPRGLALVPGPGRRAGQRAARPERWRAELLRRRAARVLRGGGPALRLPARRHAGRPGAACRRRCATGATGCTTARPRWPALCEAFDWRLDLREMAYFSHWLTPVVRPKRFDTRFFVRLAPPDQEAMPDIGEALELMWLTPDEALDPQRALKLLNVTQRTLHDMRGFASARAAYEHALALRGVALHFPRPALGRERPALHHRERPGLRRGGAASTPTVAATCAASWLPGDVTRLSPRLWRVAGATGHAFLVHRQRAQRGRDRSMPTPTMRRRARRCELWRHLRCARPCPPGPAPSAAAAAAWAPTARCACSTAARPDWPMCSSRTASPSPTRRGCRRTARASAGWRRRAASCAASAAAEPSGAGRRKAQPAQA